MPPFLLGNTYLLLSMLCASTSQLLIKSILDDIRPAGFTWPSLTTLCSDGRWLRAAVALGTLAGGFLFWLVSLTKLNLSYAYPISCSSVVIVTALSMLCLGEQVSARMLAGTLLILVGTILLSPAQ
jgi:drug/metabolite transporter (DMT)-like permease